MFSLFQTKKESTQPFVTYDLLSERLTSTLSAPVVQSWRTTARPSRDTRRLPTTASRTSSPTSTLRQTHLARMQNGSSSSSPMRRLSWRRRRLLGLRVRCIKVPAVRYGSCLLIHCRHPQTTKRHVGEGSGAEAHGAPGVSGYV